MVQLPRLARRHERECVTCFYCIKTYNPRSPLGNPEIGVAAGKLRGSRGPGGRPRGSPGPLRHNGHRRAHVAPRGEAAGKIVSVLEVAMNAPTSRPGAMMPPAGELAAKFARFGKDSGEVRPLLAMHHPRNGTSRGTGRFRGTSGDKALDRGSHFRSNALPRDSRNPRSGVEMHITYGQRHTCTRLHTSEESTDGILH
jgi:hypothetical protein